MSNEPAPMNEPQPDLMYADDGSRISWALAGGPEQCAHGYGFEGRFGPCPTCYPEPQPVATDTPDRYREFAVRIYKIKMLEGTDYNPDVLQWLEEFEDYDRDLRWAAEIAADRAAVLGEPMPASRVEE